MLQRGLLTNAEQQPTPYDTTRTHRFGTTSAEVNLHRNEEGQELNHELMGQQQQEQKERINCLPIIEMPQIKIEQDMEDYMEEEEISNNREDEEMMQQQHQESEEQHEQECRDEGQQYEPMDIVEQQQQQQPERGGGGIKPITQLLEPTSILKTSLLTGAANTLATLTAAAEQIARMPNETLNKNYPYFKEENRRTYTTTTIEDTSNKHNVSVEQTTEKNKTEIEMEGGVTTYTSILQTALMAKRPANNDNALATTATATSVTKTLHVRTPDQVLKTAVTLATLSEIAAQQEQQQLKQQQQQQQQHQQKQQQMPHILVVPQVAAATPMRKMCTLPFKKLNFANVTTTTITPSSSTISSPLLYTTTTAAAATTTTTAPNTASSINTTTNTTTIITNNYNLGSNIKANTNLINKNTKTTTTTNTKTTTIISTKQAASYNNSNNSNLSSKISNNNNNNNGNSNSNTMATQTLKIPQPHIQIKPHLVTSQTQTEETTLILPSNLTGIVEHNSSSSGSSSNNNSSSSISLTRTAVSVQTKQLIQNSSSASASTLSSSLLSSASPSASTSTSALTVTMANIKPVNTDNNKTGHIFKHNSQSATVSGTVSSVGGGGCGASISGCSKETTNTTLTKMNIIKTTKPCKDEHQHQHHHHHHPSVAMSTAAASSHTSLSSSTPATNVTVVVFETLLPED